MRHLPERPAVEPTDLNLEARQARARQLNSYDHGIVEVLNTDAQHVEDVAQHLGLARQALQSEAQRYWPDQSWESTSSGGPPREGDLHVKVQSVISDGKPSDAPCPAGVALRVGISAIRIDRETEEDVTTFGPEAALHVPLAVARKLIDALEEQLTYWTLHPPPSADEVAR